MAITESAVLKILNLLIGYLGVCPLNEVVLCLVPYDLKVVQADKLPDDCQDVLLVSIDKVIATNAWDFQAELLADFSDLATIHTALELVVGILIDSLPVYAPRRKLVTDFKNDDASLDILIEIVDVNILNVQAVDPEAEGSLISATFNIIIDDAGLLVSLLFFLVEFLKTVLGVEKLSHKDS